MKRAFLFCAGITFALLCYGSYQGLVVAPREETMGDAQRIFYYHVPAATAAYSLFFVNFVASIAFLLRRTSTADAWAKASAEVGVVFATVTLALGMIWARYAWGTWWAWDMRLTTFLILWLLYVSYGVLRRSADTASTSVLSAALAVVAFLDVPLNYMANRWFRTNHPQPVTLEDPRMKFALMTSMVAFLAFAAMVVWLRFELERIAQRITKAHIKKMAHGAFAISVLPLALFFQQSAQFEIQRQRAFMYAGYSTAWTIYLAYLLLLIFRLTRLRKEESEL